MKSTVRQRGFSLLELLVTLFVIVIIVSLASVSLNSGSRELELQSLMENFADSAGFAMDEAQLQGTDYGLLLRRDDSGADVTYRFSWRQREGQLWEAPRLDREIFAEIVLPIDVELSLELEGALVEDLGNANDRLVPAPQIVFYASGEATPGALDVRASQSGELLWRLEWDLLGRFTLMPRGIDPEDDDD
jgi:prepilin-type N-terminal cleavage/methylation domain-containing protein